MNCVWQPIAGVRGGGPGDGVVRLPRRGQGDRRPPGAVLVLCSVVNTMLQCAASWEDGNTNTTFYLTHVPSRGHYVCYAYREQAGMQVGQNNSVAAEFVSILLLWLLSFLPINCTVCRWWRCWASSAGAARSTASPST